jgi:protein SCO1/2
MLRIGLLLAVLLMPVALPAQAHSTKDGHAPQGERLPMIGPAPDFTLTDQDGRTRSLRDHRGKVIALTFIYTHCPDICPMLTANLVQVQQELGAEFGHSVAFVSITTDPERDTPPVMKGYAEAYEADLRGWAFLTGDPEAVRATIRHYGIFVAKGAGGEIDHSLLTSLIDRKGRLRVQYIGARFDLEEFRRDLLELIGEPQ